MSYSPLYLKTVCGNETSSIHSTQLITVQVWQYCVQYLSDRADNCYDILQRYMSFGRSKFQVKHSIIIEDKKLVEVMMLKRPNLQFVETD